MKKSILLACAGAVGFIAIGCGGLLGISQLIPPTGGVGSNSIVGAWKNTQISENGSTATCPGTLGTGAGAVSCDSSVTTFNSNQTYTTVTSGGITEATGAWTITGNMFTMSTTNSTSTGALSFSPNNGTYYWVVNGVQYQAARQ